MTMILELGSSGNLSTPHSLSPWIVSIEKPKLIAILDIVSLASSQLSSLSLHNFFSNNSLANDMACNTQKNLMKVDWFACRAPLKFVFGFFVADVRVGCNFTIVVDTFGRCVQRME